MTLDHEAARNRATRTRGDGQVYAGWLLTMAVVGAAATLATVSPTHGGEGARDCQGLRATVVGTARSDLLVGTTRRDVIIGGGGGDLIRARGGDDVICAGPGADRVDTGVGDDVVVAGAGADAVTSPAGNATVRGGPGKDVIRSLAPYLDPEDGDSIMVFFGGRGRDLLDATNATEGRLHGNAGDDILTEAGGGGYGVSFSGGPGRDLVVGSYGDRVLDLTGEGDTVLGDGVTVSYGRAPSGVRVSLRRERGYRIDGSGVVDRIIGALGIDGSPVDDVLIGTNRDYNYISGRQGDDRLFGLAGADVLTGDKGDDWVDGGKPEPRGGGEDLDLVYGDEGYDVCLNGHVRTDTDAGCEVTSVP